MLVRGASELIKRCVMKGALMRLQRLRRTTLRTTRSLRTEIMALSPRGARKMRFKMKLEKARIERKWENYMRRKIQKLRVTTIRKSLLKKKSIKRTIRRMMHQKMRRWPMQKTITKRVLN